MSLNFVAFVLIAFIRNSESTYGKESNDVEQEELCQAFCQLKCMKVPKYWNLQFVEKKHLGNWAENYQFFANLLFKVNA